MISETLLWFLKYINKKNPIEKVGLSKNDSFISG